MESTVEPADLSSGWLLVGRADEIPAPGEYFTWERTGIPFLVIRSADGEVRAFYNSCRHRGAPVVREARGRSRALRCQYHSWTYDTFGRLVSVPDERDFVDLRMEERPLVEVAAAVISGWVFISQNLRTRLPEVALPGEGFRLLATVVQPCAAGPAESAAALAPMFERLGHLPVAGQAPNAVFGGNFREVLALAAWPSAAGSEFVLHVCASAWDDDDDQPIESDAWQTRLDTIRGVLTEESAAIAVRT